MTNETMTPEQLLHILADEGVVVCLSNADKLDARYHKSIKHLALDFAARAVQFVPASDDRPRAAIETARAFLVGDVYTEDLEYAIKNLEDSHREVSGAMAECDNWHLNVAVEYFSVNAVVHAVGLMPRDFPMAQVAASTSAVAAHGDGNWSSCVEELGHQKEQLSALLKSFIAGFDYVQ